MCLVASVHVCVCVSNIWNAVRYVTQSFLVESVISDWGLRGRPLMIWRRARRKNRKWIYFSRWNAFLELFIFSWGMPFRDLFFPGEGPPEFFLSRFPPAPPPDH